MDYHSTKNQEILRELVHRNVGNCVSGLMDHFLSNPSSLDGSDYSYDDLLEASSKIDWEAVIEDCVALLDADEVLEELDVDPDDSELRSKLVEAIIDSGDAMSYADKYGIDPGDYRQDVLEWWIVDRWFGEKLSLTGESVIELFDLTIWGRTCSGQSILLDHCIAEIAQEMEILEGQKYEWK